MSYLYMNIFILYLQNHLLKHMQHFLIIKQYLFVAIFIFLDRNPKYKFSFTSLFVLLF